MWDLSILAANFFKDNFEQSKAAFLVLTSFKHFIDIFTHSKIKFIHYFNFII